MGWGKCLSLCFVLFTAWSSSAQAKVEFKQRSYEFTATVNLNFDVDLKALLDPTVTPGGAVKWQGVGDVPDWLSINQAAARMSGVPKNQHAGKNTFTLFVSDADTGDNVPVTITVPLPIEPPKWTKNDIDLGIQNEDKPWTFDLNPFVTNDPNGGPISFFAAGLPSWMSLNQATGILSGTPKRDDVGDYKNIIFTAKSKGGTADATAHGKVLKTIHPPKWTQNPIVLADAFEDTAYVQELIAFVSNPEGPTAAPLTFKINAHTAPAWLNIGATTATLSGMPKKPGNYDLTVQLSTRIDGQSFTDTTVVRVKIIHVNHAPLWTANPINLPDVLTKSPFSQDLSKSAVDPDADPLTYKIVSGPAWATINPNTGILSGTPDKANVGMNSWVISATDPAGAHAETQVILRVIKANEPPVWIAHPTFLPDANEDKAYEIDLTNYATDSDGDPMFFTKLDGNAGITISASGKLLWTPGAKDVGFAKLNVMVSDNKSLPNDITELRILVIHTNHAPRWILDPIRLFAKEDQPFNGSVSVFARDPDNDTPLVYSAVSGNPWATLSPTGVFTGTPGKANVGDNTYKVVVMDPGGLTAEVTVIIQVEHVNHKPYWTGDPIDLPATKEESPYTTSVAQYAADPDGDALRFVKVGGAAWASVDAAGNITGTPMDPGEYTVQVRVTDPSNESAVTTFRIHVDKINHAPYWRQNPILMANGFEDTAYSFALTLYAVDPDGDALTYKLVNGPAWMTVSADGVVTGTPTGTDVGNFTATFSVKDAEFEVQTTGTGDILDKNHPPVIDPAMPEFTVKERDVTPIDLTQYVKDQDGDKFTCSLVDNVEWLTMDANCVLTSKAQFKHIGSHSFNFRADDGETSVTGVVKIKVIRNPRPPVWIQNPIVIKVRTNENFQVSIHDQVRDLDGLKVTLAMTPSKPWVTMDQTGNLKGRPTDTQLGKNSFEVSACNTDPSCATTELILEVVPGTHIDQHDVATTGGTAEHLWVIDNSSYCSNTIAELKRHSRFFFEDLNKGLSKHTGLVISADPDQFDGDPIHRPGETGLILSGTGITATTLATDFSKKVDLAYSGGKCGNCYNSPIFAMWRLFFQAPTLPENIYHNGYWMPFVPMDVMIVTHQLDHYKAYIRNLPQLKGYTASEFTRDYVEFHSKDNKAIRVSAIAPQCPTLLELSGDASSVAPPNAYGTVVTKTNGKYYTTTCDFNMSATLKDYAKRIVQRASIQGKSRFKLSKTPISLLTIKVVLAGTVLPGNTGAPNDLWTYDTATNEVILFWNKIDDTKVPAGAKIEIEFRVS